MSDSVPREFKILCVDGGGIKGTYSAFLLAYLEKQLGKGKRHGEYFDMVSGTSTGSLIALGLAAGRSASEIADAYEKDGGKIFCDHGFFHRTGRTIRQLFTHARYHPRALEETLELLLKGKTLADASNYVCIPVTVMNNYSLRVYKIGHSEKHSWSNVSLKHLALASSAAPTFFPLVESEAVNGTLYADGGLYANNPSLVALIEALRVFVGDDSERKEFDSQSFRLDPSPARCILRFPGGVTCQFSPTTSNSALQLGGGRGPSADGCGLQAPALHRSSMFSCKFRVRTSNTFFRSSRRC